MYTEIYFDKDDPEMVEYQSEMTKALAGEKYNASVLKQWYSEPVPVYVSGAAEGETPDFKWVVLLTDEQYAARKKMFVGKAEDLATDVDIKLTDAIAIAKKQTDMKSKKAVDKSFNLLEAKFKRPDNKPLHVFGPKGGPQLAPEDRPISKIETKPKVIEGEK